MPNLNLQRINRNSSVNSSPYAFLPPTPVQADIDLSMPLRGIAGFLSGQLQTGAGGGADPAAQLNILLKLIATMQLTLQTDAGDVPIIPAGTRFWNYFEFIDALAVMNGTLPGEMYNHPKPTLGGAVERPFTGLATTLAASPENFVLPFYIPFSMPGGTPEERDRTALVPKKTDRGLRLTLNPAAIQNGVALVANVAADFPVPGSTRVYTFAGFGAVGACQVEIFPDQIPMMKVAGEFPRSANFGSYLPVYQSQRLIVPTGGAATQRLDNWQREGKMRAVYFSSSRRTTATGATASLVANTGWANYGLRDWFLLANSQEIRRENLLRCGVACRGTGTTDATSENGFCIDFMRGGSFDSLPDYTGLVALNTQLNMEFQNVTAGGAGTEDLHDVMTVRYLPR